jgi:hypothetical protein
MPLYQVIGLRTFSRKSTTYQVDRAGFIMKDAQGKPLVEPYKFTHYVIYVQDKTDDSLYSIELFDSVGASFGKRGQICRYGHMQVSAIDKHDIQLMYLPMRDLAFEHDLHVGMYDFDDDVDVYEYDAETPASQRIFAFSSIGGGDERVPDGYVLVNMDHFFETRPTHHCVDVSCTMFPWGTN